LENNKTVYISFHRLGDIFSFRIKGNEDKSSRMSELPMDSGKNELLTYLNIPKILGYEKK
jgi:hypothetical protein